MKPAEDDLLIFAGEPDGPEDRRKGSWNVLIVDDDQEVHAVTRFALGDIQFEGRHLEFHSAYSAREGERILAEIPDIAVILLDVVMETDRAGLDFVKTIRETVGNRLTRIILRTGQPGQAPEAHVVLDYDIDNYKAKSELTAIRLVTSVISALRSYRDLSMLEATRQGLQKILEISDDLMTMPTAERFAERALERAAELIAVPADGMLCVAASGRAGPGGDAGVRILAAAGRHATPQPDGTPDPTRSPEAAALLDRCLAERRSIHDDDATALYLGSGGSVAALVLEHAGAHPGEMTRRLLDVLASKIAIGLENVSRLESVMLARMAAEEASRSKSDLLAAMSHELRTPLNAILGFGQLMQADKNSPLAAEQRQRLDSIVSAGEQLLLMVTDVLAYVEAGDQPPNLRPDGFAVAVSVERSIARTRNRLGRRNIADIRLEAFDGPALRAAGDPIWFEKALDQLLDNAVRHSGRSGGPVRVSIDVRDGHVRTLIADSGPGIDPQRQESIFRPFAGQAEDATKAHQGGTGIGLALAKRLVERLDGCIGLESRLGEGARFWIDLPLLDTP